MNLADLDFEVKDLLVDAAADASAVEPAIISLVGRLKQEGLQDGRLGLFARVGPVGADIPPVNAAVCLIGFDLTPFERLVPPATLTLLGGKGLDFATDVAVKSTAEAGIKGNLKDAGSALDAWRQATDTRWEAAWAAAREQVSKATFPPSREALSP